jgi:hypothetical protein
MLLIVAHDMVDSKNLGEYMVGSNHVAPDPDQDPAADCVLP